MSKQKELSLEELELSSQSSQIALNNKLTRLLRSESVQDVLEATSFLKSQSGKQEEIKSVFFDPYDSSAGSYYKEQKGGVSFDTLRRMGNIHIIRSIINTRVEQVQNFLHFSVDEQKEGYAIRKKRGLWGGEKKEGEVTDGEKKRIEEIVEFIEGGGYQEKWDNTDSFQDFVRKIANDSLTLDQLSFEILRTNGGELSKFKAVDASRIRLLDSEDPRFANLFEQYRYKGYLPRYAMVLDNQILTNTTTGERILYYPWELGYGVRNVTTSIFRNGYGVSELEVLIEIMTWILWGFQYNGNFFRQGSQPKGFINVKGNIDNSTLNEFRQAWSQTMRGVQNSHKTPIMQGLDLEWIDLQKNNRDMEFNEWLQFLFLMVCAVYRIDPSELGFQFRSLASPMGQDGQRERLQHSRSKGLKPLLIFLQNIINKYLISELDKDYEFYFTGIDVEDEGIQVELDSKKLQNGMVSMRDMFEKYSGRGFDEKNDIILNGVYQQVQNQKMIGGQDMNSIADESDENPFNFDEGNPFESQGGDSFRGSESFNPFEGNPIMEKSLEILNNRWKNE